MSTRIRSGRRRTESGATRDAKSGRGRCTTARSPSGCSIADSAPAEVTVRLARSSDCAAHSLCVTCGAARICRGHSETVFRHGTATWRGIREDRPSAPELPDPRRSIPVKKNQFRSSPPCLAGFAHGQRAGIGAPTGWADDPPALSALVEFARGESLLRIAVVRYTQDVEAVERRYPVLFSPARIARLRKLHEGWRQRLAELDFATLDREGAGRLPRAAQPHRLFPRIPQAGRTERAAQIGPLLPFFDDIRRLQEKRFDRKPVEARAAAATVLDRITKQANELTKQLKTAAGRRRTAASRRATPGHARRRRGACGVRDPATTRDAHGLSWLLRWLRSRVFVVGTPALCRGRRGAAGSTPRPSNRSC